MNLEEAIREFQSEREGVYSEQSKALILELAQELGLTDFQIKRRSDVLTKRGLPYSQYIFDTEDKVHFHPLMIVSRLFFVGCDANKKSKYKLFPFFAELSHWKSDANAGQPICPHCFLEIPLVGQCGVCAFDPDDISSELS